MVRRGATPAITAHPTMASDSLSGTNAETLGPHHLLLDPPDRPTLPGGIIARSGPVTLPCEERERLQKQYEDLRRAAAELESRLCAEIVSSDHSVKARAKNELERAEKRAFHVMMELTDHGKRHGCVNYEKPQ